MEMAGHLRRLPRKAVESLPLEAYIICWASSQQPDLANRALCRGLEIMTSGSPF